LTLAFNQLLPIANLASNSYNVAIDNQFFIIDFDSTIVTVEALDELATIALNNSKDEEKITKKISDITKLGMEGYIDFPTSLKRRLALFKPNKKHVKELVSFLKKHITPSVERNLEFFRANASRIYVITGGFEEYVYPVVQSLGIKKSHVLANTFTYNNKGDITGFDRKNPMAKPMGKAICVKNLKLKGNICVIGDGITDYQIVERKAADKFFAFIEIVARKAVVAKADKVIRNFDELLHLFHLPRSQSYPKSKMKVLLLENIHKNAYEQFIKEGYQVETYPQSFEEEELIKKLQDVSVVGIGSRTQITRKVAENAKRLLAVARFGIGTNNIDLQACSENGIAVFNAPFSNTRSVVELVLGEIIMLYRRVFDKSEKLHRGIWDKSAKDCHELRGKKLGIIGYGNIGSQLSVLAEMIGMDVYFYDIVEKLALGKAKHCLTLKELLKTADVITLHVDGRKENTNLIDEKEFELMKHGVIFINTSRGHVVNVDSLAKYIKNGKVIGAALDVFPKEPKSNDELFSSVIQKLPNVILTPHIGGRSEEAQAHMGTFVPERIASFMNFGNTILSVNFPNITLPEHTNAHRFLHIHKNIPGMLAKINTSISEAHANILGQYLKTNETIGYVITDINKKYDKILTKKLREIPGTIRVRELY